MIDTTHPTTIPASANDNPSHTIEQDVQQLMLALTRLLVGPRGDPYGSRFNGMMMVMVGAPLDTGGLLWLAELARLNRRHLIHLSLTPACPIPGIAFAHRQGDIVSIYERCFLTLRHDRDRACIVPDSFQQGTFQLVADMRLERSKASASFDTSLPLMKRAYERFDMLLGSAAPSDDWQPLRVAAR